MAEHMVLPLWEAAKSCVAGTRFGKWTVLEEAPKRHGNRYDFVRCDCGEQRSVQRNTLLSGRSTSCGKCRRRRQLQRKGHAITHGMTQRGQYHPLYRAWQRMRTRCTNRKFPRFHDWGGRGIGCEQWRNFPAFLDDMGLTWRPGLTLDRIDNDGHYEPGNCRWATRKDQARNKRNNVVVDTPFGRMCIAEAAERSGIPATTLYSRHQTGRPLFP